MKIVIENTVMLNAGDAAILLAIMKILQHAFGNDLEFFVFDKDPEIASRYYPGIAFYPMTTQVLKAEPAPLPILNQHWNIRLRRNVQRLKTWYWTTVLRGGIDKSGFYLGVPVNFTGQLHRNVSIYAQADLVISTGGTYLVEHYSVDSCFEEFDKDFALGKPLVLFTQSLGPFDKPENVARMKRVADKAKLLLLRDSRSEQNLREIGVKSQNLAVVADSVFAFADMKTLQLPFPGPKSAKKRVAVSVRKWNHFDDLDPETGMQRYRQSVANAVKALVMEKGCEVVFLSTCQGIEEYRYDDSEVGAEIYDMLDEETKLSVSVDRGFHTPQKLMDKLRSFDFVIATRMHMAIMSLCVGVPVLPIAYEFKMLELFKNLSLDEWVTDISSLEPDTYGSKALRFSEQLATFYALAMPELVKQASSALSAGTLVAAATGLSASTAKDKA